MLDFLPRRRTRRFTLLNDRGIAALAAALAALLALAFVARGLG